MKGVLLLAAVGCAAGVSLVFALHAPKPTAAIFIPVVVAGFLAVNVVALRMKGRWRQNAREAGLPALVLIFVLVPAFASFGLAGQWQLLPQTITFTLHRAFPVLILGCVGMVLARTFARSRGEGRKLLLRAVGVAVTFGLGSVPILLLTWIVGGRMLAEYGLLAASIVGGAIAAITSVSLFAGTAWWLSAPQKSAAKGAA
jgi:hypothetical protein